MRFTLTASCPESSARAGCLELPRGSLDTPVFMPVGTNGTVKTLRPQDLHALGYSLVLANTYHLYLRPGMDVIRGAGGLHRFCSWTGNLLTDSGGFQVFSLAQQCKVLDEGVEFRSHLDGSRHYFTPESVVDIQQVLGSEIMMPLDECTAAGISEQQAAVAEERTWNWARAAHTHWRETIDQEQQVLFAIVQGNMFPALRRRSAERLTGLDFPGYALGGFSVGERKEVMYPVLEESAALLPADRPRYLMGVGEPLDVVEAVGMGVDMFDCVMPTRNARNASLFTADGPVSIRNERFRNRFGPFDPECTCPACQNFEAAFLRHLFKCGEILGLELATLHNLHFMARLMDNIRTAIRDGRFGVFRAQFRARWKRGRS